jgi:hypothetical protein
MTSKILIFTVLSNMLLIAILIHYQTTDKDSQIEL